jgi:hypothetical protein
VRQELRQEVRQELRQELSQELRQELQQILIVMFDQVFALGNARGAKGAMTRGDRVMDLKNGI